MNEETKKIIEEVNTNMCLVSMPLTIQDKDILCRCLNEKSSFEKE